ncbi:MAG TPA: hypothetical protein VGT40_01985 [Methylomirabilota bacterium]|jgi:hypothetical protein|nr:hypothetical protein [Methylomirabilota bacterium]
MTAIIAALLVGALFLGPLVWRIRLDKREARADAVAADIRAAVNRRLRGESLLSVFVIPPSLSRTGRIVLSAPTGYEWLIETAWRDVVSHAPSDYDVVFKARDSRAVGSTRASGGPALARAA